MNRIILLFIFSIILLSVGNLKSQSSLLTGPEIHGGIIELEEDGYKDIGMIILSHLESSKGKISLQVKDLSGFRKGENWGIVLPVRVRRWDRFGQELVTENVILSLSWNGTTLVGGEGSVSIIQGAYKLRIEVGQETLSGVLSSVQFLPNWLELNTDFEVDRNYLPFFGSINTGSRIDNANREIEFYWSYFLGAEKYELEYVLLENDIYDPLLVVGNQFEGATRIITNEQFYRIANTYESGVLLFRVRPLHKNFTSDCKYFYGAWSVPGNLSLNDFEQGRTWAYSSAYSSDGVKSETVSYFDPTGRVRQVLSKDGENEVSSVVEEFYDYNGLASIKTLPGIIPGKSLAFKEGFTRDVNDNLYNKSNFATDGKLDSPDKIGNPKNSVGQVFNNYFSPNNPFIGDGVHDYIADAEGYGFITSKFDVQGRVSKVSGAGLNLNMGSGKETEIYYSGVSQYELDKLFGNEVGDASHYSQILTKDPNGNHNIQYFDLGGNLIAHGIVGDSPGNLEEVNTSNYLKTTDVKQDLVKEGFNVVNKEEGRSYTNYDLMVKSAGPHKFKLKISKSDYSSICYSLETGCAYDLTLRLNNNYGEKTNFSITKNTSSTNHIGEYTVPIDKSNFINGYYELEVSANLQIGQYKFYKELALSQGKMDKAVIDFEQALRNGSTSCFGIKSLAEIEIEKRSKIYENPDDYLCNSCYDACGDFAKKYLYVKDNFNISGLGDYQEIILGDINRDFYKKLETVTFPENSILDGYKEGTYQLITYNDVNNKCKLELCDRGKIPAPVKAAEDCEGKQKVLMADLSPGGQYFDNKGRYEQGDIPKEADTQAEIDSKATEHIAGNTWLKAAIDENDFFSSSGAGAAWKVNDPKNPNQEISLVELNTTTDNWDNLYELIRQYWKAEWAADLLAYHPEYCTYKWCVDVGKNYQTFQDKLMASDYKGAKLLFGIDFTSNVNLNHTGLKDPFYLASADNANFGFNSLYTSAIGLYPNGGMFLSTGSSTLGIMNLAIKMYEDQYEIVYASSTDLEKDDKVWGFYRQLYLKLRSNLVDKAYQKFYKECTSSDDYGWTYNYTGSGNFFEKQILFEPSLEIEDYTEGSPYTYEENLVSPAVIFKVNYPSFDLNSLNPLFVLGRAQVEDKLRSFDPSGIWSVQKEKCFEAEYLKKSYSNHIRNPNPDDYVQSIKFEIHTHSNVTNDVTVAEITFSPYKKYKDISIEDYNKLLNKVNYNSNSIYIKQVPKDNYSQTIYSFEILFDLEMVKQEYNLSQYSNLDLYTITVGAPNYYGGTRGAYGSELEPILNQYKCVEEPKNCFCERMDNLAEEFRDMTNSEKLTYKNENSLTTTLTENSFILQEFKNHNGYKSSDGNYYFTNPLSKQGNLQISEENIVQWFTNCSGSNNYQNIKHPESIGITHNLPAVSKTVPIELTCYKPEDECFRDALFRAKNEALIEYENQITKAVEDFKKQYVNNCLGRITESISLEYSTKEYMYTLYYYDVAGNLRATVSPEGVRPLDENQIKQVQDYRGLVISHPVDDFTKADLWNPTTVNDPQYVINYGETPNFVGVITNSLNAGAIRTFSNLTVGKQYTLNIQLELQNNNPVFMAVRDANQGVLVNTSASSSGEYIVSFTATTSNGNIHIGNLLANSVSSQFRITSFQILESGSVGSPIYLEDHHNIAQTNYFDYNTLGGVYKSVSPDQGVSNFYFDEYGRPVISQNAKQAVAFGIGRTHYSFTTYDAIGRVDLVGAIHTTTNNPAEIELIARNQGTGTITTYAQWLADASDYEVTKSFYELHNAHVTAEIASYGLPTQIYGTQRNALSMVAYYENGTQNVNTLTAYDHAIAYAYDHQGRLLTQVTHHPKEGNDKWALKTVNYLFDAFSGLTETIEYQGGKEDQHFTYLEYDKNQRLTRTYTSSDGINKELEQKNLYYLHGAKYRTEIGDHQIQGIDMVSTLQGGIKAVNSNTLNARRDIGRDGISHNSKITDGNLQAQDNRSFARDAAGYSLKYRNNDYFALNNNLEHNSPFLAQLTSSEISSQEKEFYNGLISSSATSIRNPANMDVLPQYHVYHYDNAYRLTEMIAFRNTDKGASDTWGGAKMYNGNTETSDKTQSVNYVKIAYDLNTNITHLSRNDGQGGEQDELTYNYQYNTRGLAGNQLRNVNQDAQNISGACFKATEYQYDEIGQIKFDLAGKYQVHWNTNRKMSAVTVVDPLVGGPNLEFIYNALGQRIGKIEKPRGSAGTGSPYVVSPQSDWNYTYYALDASGNTLATYTHKYNNQGQIVEVKLDEQVLYGDTRLGVKNQHKTLTGAVPPTTGVFNNVIGKKSYEFTNWLGSVITVFTDVKVLKTESVGSDISSSFEGGDDALFYTYNPYETGASNTLAAFSGSKSILISNYAQEWGPSILEEVKPGDVITKTEIYARKVQNYTVGAIFVRYLMDRNREILYTDANAQTPIWFNAGSPDTDSWEKLEFNGNLIVPSTLYRADGTIVNWEHEPVYFIAFPWGAPNTDATYFDDFKVSITHNSNQYYEPIITQSNDFDPYGSDLSGRNFTTGTDYRFGYQGSEKNPELGQGSYTTFFRQLNSSLGRWMSPDPVFQPHQSPYCSMDGNPVNLTDFMGDNADNNCSEEDDCNTEADNSTTTTNTNSNSNEKKLVSFLVVGDKKGDKAREARIKSIEGTEWILIEAKDAKDALKQIKKRTAELNAEVNNIAFTSHGDYRSLKASFNIGDEKFSTSELKIQSKRDDLNAFSELNMKGKVIITACHAGAVHNGGKKLLVSVSGLMKATVYGNQSWSPAWSSMNIKGGVTGNDDGSNVLMYIKSSEYTYRDRQHAFDNAGKWTMVEFNNEGTKISDSDALYFNTDGSFGIYPKYGAFNNSDKVNMPYRLIEKKIEYGRLNPTINF